MNFSVTKYLNLSNVSRQKIAATALVLAIVFSILFYFGYSLGAVSDSPQPSKVFEIKTGEGFRSIVDRLEYDELIRSRAAFKALSIVTGSAFKLKPGSYKLSSSMTSYGILNELILGSHPEVAATIPEGSNVYEIDKILSENGITKKGDFISTVLKRKLEGRLFPDTYKFFIDSSPEEVVDKFLDNFDFKTKDLSGREVKDEDLVLASLLEKEVPDLEDQRVVAGILKKRLEAGIPLQVDATICYIKAALSPNQDVNCYPLSPLDFKINSPYNTYLNRGLPPGPIGNPGVSAMESALNPKASPYLFYLSDPATRKTVFAKTLEEQIKNKARYLQ